MNDFQITEFFIVPACLPACNPIQGLFFSHSTTQICITFAACVCSYSPRISYCIIDCYKMTMKCIFMIINKNHRFGIEVHTGTNLVKGDTKKKKK